MRCLIAGSGSEIAKELAMRLRADGWDVEGTKGRSLTVPPGKWDMLILAHGQMSPIDRFFECDATEWVGAVMVNAIYPLACLRAAWPERGEKPTVIFMGGPNIMRSNPTYTAYRAGKVMIGAMCGTLEEEYPGCRFRVLHPGVVRTKIHEQTLRAGHKAANYERAMRVMNGTEETVGHDEVYERLKALL